MFFLKKTTHFRSFFLKLYYINMHHLHALPKHFRLGLIHGGFVPHHRKHHRRTSDMRYGEGTPHQKLLESEFASMDIEGKGIKKRHLKPLTFRR